MNLRGSSGGHGKREGWMKMASKWHSCKVISIYVTWKPRDLCFMKCGLKRILACFPPSRLESKCAEALFYGFPWGLWAGVGVAAAVANAASAPQAPPVCKVLRQKHSEIIPRRHRVLRRTILSLYWGSPTGAEKLRGQR